MKASMRLLNLGLLLILLFSACSTFVDSQDAALEEINKEIPKRILFCGDSITWGELGSSYLSMLEEQYPDYELKNLGLDGDTVSGIMNRTITHLQQDDNYDMIIISAGHNDIILPAFMNKTISYRFIVKYKKLQGSIPAENYSDFISTYTKFIDSVREISSAPIVLVTLSCLNEDMNASTNQQRLIYNQGIRELSADKSTGLADVGIVFNEQLKNYECRDFLMKNLLESAFFDRSRSKTVKGIEKLSKKRLLHLTIDGVHLNPAGAEIYSNLMSPFISNL